MTQLQDIKYTLVYNAPISKVWDAVATAEGLAAWFMPNDMQPVEGHEFHLNAGQWDVPLQSDSGGPAK